MARIVQRGQGKLNFEDLSHRLKSGLVALFNQGRIHRYRRVTSLFHYFIAWGFIYYLLVNLVDVAEGYLPGFQFLGETAAGGIFRLLADLLSVGVLVGMSYFLVRRFMVRDPALSYHDNVKLLPEVIPGIRRDSLIVGAVIWWHVGFRFLGSAFRVAMEGWDPWQPFASLVALGLAALPSGVLAVGWHLSWWVALGLILLFMPYFPYTKHAHLFM